MSRLYSHVAFAAFVLAAAPAAAETGSVVPGFSSETNADRIAQQITPFITTVRQGDLFNALSIVPNNQFTGVGGLFIQAPNSGGSGTLCTAALISSTIAVTAAHCLDSNIATIDFFLPDYVAGAGREVVRASGWALHPDYDPAQGVLGGNDIAVIRLGRDVTGREIYDIERSASGLGTVHTKVGTGTIGVGATGTFPGGLDFDGEKRSGSNVYEYTWDQLIGSNGVVDNLGGAPVNSILMFDFDSGSPLEDAFGRLTGLRQTGVVDGSGRVRDVNSSPGDSGGPTFINGRIAGITSFGITANAFEPVNVNCGDPTSIDQSFDLETGACTNSSFGELSGDTRVAAFAGWVDLYLSGNGVFQAVPEPATWAMMIAGFGLVGGSMRRRRPVAIAA